MQATARKLYQTIRSVRRYALIASTMLVSSIAIADAPPVPTGWMATFVDDFDGPAGAQPSRAHWFYNIGHNSPGGPDNWGNDEVQYYTDLPANVGFNGNGELHITALRDNAGEWTSARLQTYAETFKAPEGGVMHVEARIKLPGVNGEAALGYWPAFWMLAGVDAPGWPSGGEFDIMENVNGLNRHWGVFHCGTFPGGPCNEPNGIGLSQPCPGASCQDDFHVYAFQWDRSVVPSRLRWYIDGQLYHRIDESMLPASTWADMQSHGGFTILLNLAMGGSFPDGVAMRRTPTWMTESGHAMCVDYVAVWTRDHGLAPLERSDGMAYAKLQKPSIAE
jgi:beta-glucanase (GH16 family)